MDWTKISKDPLNKQAVKEVKTHLLKIKTMVDDMFFDHVIKEISGKRVLDIGVCEHDLHYIDKERWRHKKICEHAGYCLGIDILDDLVNELNQRGYNVRNVDATSDIDLGERFDVIFIGDVLEHVNNAVDLLKFSARHLAPGGKIIAITPNLFYFRLWLEVLIHGTLIANLDHVAGYCPCMVLELSRRAGIKFNRYIFFKRSNKFWKYLVKKIAPAELISPMHYYEFCLKDNNDN